MGPVLIRGLLRLQLLIIYVHLHVYHGDRHDDLLAHLHGHARLFHHNGVDGQHACGLLHLSVRARVSLRDGGGHDPCGHDDGVHHVRVNANVCILGDRDDDLPLQCLGRGQPFQLLRVLLDSSLNILYIL